MHDLTLIKVSNAFVIALFATTTLLCGCDQQPWNDPGPKDVFDAFLIHWFRGESDLAFDYILPADREVLTAPLAQASDIPEDVRPEPSDMLVVAEIENVYDISKMEVSETFESEPPDGQSVTLTLHHQDGMKSHAKLVWSTGRWYVDLPLAPKS